jgi:RNA 2',3'-cyclic 3'-phosphodiesterase
MKRLFAAIKVSPDSEFLDGFRDLRQLLKHEKIKWVEEHNIHITLKFFGETEENRIPLICKILENVASVSADFTFSLNNLGIFGSRYDPRVIWIGITPFDEMASVMKTLRNSLEKAGFESDRQNIVPHLTLGRIKFLNDKTAFQKIIDENRDLSSTEIRAGKFILFESILKKEGPVYLALQSFPLRKP